MTEPLRTRQLELNNLYPVLHNLLIYDLSRACKDANISFEFICDQQMYFTPYQRSLRQQNNVGKKLYSQGTFCCGFKHIQFPDLLATTF